MTRYDEIRARWKRAAKSSWPKEKWFAWKQLRKYLGIVSPSVSEARKWADLAEKGFIHHEHT